MAKPSDIKEKIRNLLALAESPEENEAKAALLKARELMAKHKLTEAELGEAKKQAVKNVLTDVTCRPLDLQPLGSHWRKLLLQGLQEPHQRSADADHRLYRS